MGCVGVQAGGGLIQEEHPGVCDECDANVGSLCLQGSQNRHVSLTIQWSQQLGIKGNICTKSSACRCRRSLYCWSLVRHIPHHTQVIAM